MKLFFLLFLFLTAVVNGQTVGKVVGITDGDTFTLLKEDSTTIKVRFHGIDCPEKSQPFANVCKKYLSDLIYGKTVSLQKNGIDRYGRTLAIVFIDTINVNETLLSTGFAWHYKSYDKNSKWSDLEINAKKNKKGLWADKNPIPPWEWRKKRLRN